MDIWKNYRKMNPLDLETTEEVSGEPVIPVLKEIKAYMKREDRTTSWLARKLSISHTTMAKFLKGENKNIKKYVKLMNAELGTKFVFSELDNNGQVNN